MTGAGPSSARPAQLTVVPSGGLGNRMRVIRSAYAVAAEGLCPVSVAFASNAECRCRFADVFQPIRIPDSHIHFSDFHIRRATIADAPSQLRRNLRLPALLRRMAYDRCYYDFGAFPGDDIREALSGGGRVFISTCYEFAGQEIPMRELFRPSSAVARIVDAAASRFGQYAVGFHVRTGDNVEAMRHSPLGLFLAAARREAASHTDAKFFLATDSPAVRKAFRDEFGERVITLRGPLTRSSRAGMTLAAADMFALSRCAKIYGSHYSSFSEIAAELGGKQAEILRM